MDTISRLPKLYSEAEGAKELGISVATLKRRNCSRGWLLGADVSIDFSC